MSSTITTTTPSSPEGIGGMTNGHDDYGETLSSSTHPIIKKKESCSKISVHPSLSKSIISSSSSKSTEKNHSNSSSLESLNSTMSSISSNSSISSDSSNGSDSVAVKPVQPFVSKMKATATPFVSKMKADAAPFVPSRVYQVQQTTENGNSNIGTTTIQNSKNSACYPSSLPHITMTMTSSTERLPASSACLVPDSVPVNVNGIIEHLTRYCPEEGPGIHSRLISVKGEYFYATSTTGNGNGNNRNGRNGTFTKQSPTANCAPAVSGNSQNGYKGGKFQPKAGRQNSHPGTNNHHQKKNRHFSGPTSPTIPVQHHNNDLYPCSLCPSINGNSSPHCSGSGADLREGRDARDTFLRNRSFSVSAVGNGNGNEFKTVSTIVTSASEHLLLPHNLRPVPRSLSLAECAYLYCNYRKQRKSSVYNLTDVENGNHIITSGRSAFDMHDTRFDVLTYDQVLCLQEVLGQVISIQTNPEPGVGELVSFPLMDLVMAVRERLLLKGIALYDIRLNGGAASYVLSLPTSPGNEKQNDSGTPGEVDNAAAALVSSATRHYNDIDLIFSVDLPTSEEYELVREAVLEVLLALMPKHLESNNNNGGNSTRQPNHRRAIEHLVNKMVKIDEPLDRWSLISLVNSAGRNVELKFVDTMRRQYEFSVDSFQIVLDTLLAFCSFFVCSSISKTSSAKAITSGSSSLTENANNKPVSLTKQWELLPITPNFYPTVIGESMYGNFTESLVHLHHRLIVTKNPEEIRGGGLLKYISLLVRDYAPIDEEALTLLEPYMCTRFLIDFIYQDRHRDKLTNYLETHFEEDTLTKYNFLIVLQATVRRSSSLAAHHSEALVIFEELILETYIQLLLEFLHLYMTDGAKLQDFYGRAVGARLCLCSKSLARNCHHRYLAPLYCLTAPLVVTYVEDVYQPSASVEDRRLGLASFIDAHDELFPFYGGYTFAFLPSSLFDSSLESNHYVVSSSTLKAGVPGPVSYVPADPPSPTDFMCTFLMKTSTESFGSSSSSRVSGPSTVSGGSNQPNNCVKIIPLGVQDLLPKSFYPVDASDRLQNFITPALASHFFFPITPPPAYRLCIVNRVPVYHSASIASGPIYHSAIFSAHSNSAPAPPTVPSGVTLEPLYAHARGHSTYGQISAHVHHSHPHSHHHPHHHYPHHQHYHHQHHHHHQPHPHGALSLYHPISPYQSSPVASNSHFNNGRGPKKAASAYYNTPHGQNNSYRSGGNNQNHSQYHQQHHQQNQYHHHLNHHNHHHQSHYQHQHPTYQHSISMPAGSSHNCSEIIAVAASQHSQQPEVEPLRIVYPRMPFDQVQKLFPLTPQALFPGCTALMQVDGTIIATTTPPSSNVEVSNGKMVEIVTSKPPMAIPQISINDSLINLHSDTEWPAPGEIKPNEASYGKGQGSSKKSRKNATVTASVSTTSSFTPVIFTTSNEPETVEPLATSLVALYSRNNSYSAAANPYYPAKLLLNKATNTSPVHRKSTLPPAAVPSVAASVSAVTVASTA